MKQLHKLSNKQFYQDIKKFITCSHEFYEIKTPELETMAKRLHDEHPLNDFYKIFNKLWNSGYQNERALAIQSLKCYKDDFDINTWYFIKSKLKQIKSWDQIDNIAIDILGEMLIKFPSFQKEIIKLSNSKDPWLIRLSLNSTIPKIRKAESIQDFNLSFSLIKLHLYDKNKQIQEVIGNIIKEIQNKKKSIAKNFILKHMDMPELTFQIATEKNKELRKLRNLKKLKDNKKGFWFLNI